MKAQTAKNAVIVPVGAKGGFVVKRPPVDRHALADEVLECYRTFIRGLLDLTDNLVDGAIVHPRCGCTDGDDAYLVVAADKGTASFSDVANALADDYRYWLGDAFASGGSSGYDHKAMGITARGAWISVRAHFRAMGVDADTAPLTVVGIGDMSGDVFGNGLLRSPHVRLLAAFDHRHVFVDPDPDPASSFVERRRLFDLAGSSWAAYDAALLSPGGGVYPRSAKAVPLSAEARAALGFDPSGAPPTPDDVVSAILRAPVDLLWNGGIGTFVKATGESTTDVGDRATDSVRVDATDLRCRVIGEGGNLGLTQAARVEYALHGGRVYSDAIDNSAGVDCSDHEVNIKILLQGAIRAGRLDPADRDTLLVVDDRRGGRPGPRRQRGAGERAPDRVGRGTRVGRRARVTDGAARARRSARPFARGPSRRQAPPGAGCGTSRPHGARARDPARLHQDRVEAATRRLGRPRRRVLRDRPHRILPRDPAGSIRGSRAPTSTRARDHRHRCRQRSREPGGHQLPLAPVRRVGVPPAGDRPRPRDRARRVRRPLDLVGGRRVGSGRAGRHARPPVPRRSPSGRARSALVRPPRCRLARA